jgi:hypothetical protein
MHAQRVAGSADSRNQRLSLGGELLARSLGSVLRPGDSLPARHMERQLSRKLNSVRGLGSAAYVHGLQQQTTSRARAHLARACWG